MNPSIITQEILDVGIQAMLALPKDQNSIEL